MFVAYIFFILGILSLIAQLINKGSLVLPLSLIGTGLFLKSVDLLIKLYNKRKKYNELQKYNERQ